MVFLKIRSGEYFNKILLGIRNCQIGVFLLFVSICLSRTHTWTCTSVCALSASFHFSVSELYRYIVTWIANNGVESLSIRHVCGFVADSSIRGWMSSFTLSINRSIDPSNAVSVCELALREKDDFFHFHQPYVFSRQMEAMAEWLPLLSLYIFIA